MVCIGEICNDRCTGVAFLFVKDIAFRNAITAKFHCVRIMFDLQNTPMDIICMFGKKFFNVVAVDFQSAAVAVICCEWFCTSQLSEANPSNRRPDRSSGDSASCFASQVSAEKEADLFYHCLP
jgi:hypothetical protein